MIMGLFPLFLLIALLETSQAWFGNTPDFVRIEPQTPAALQKKQSFLQANWFGSNRKPSLPVSYQKKQVFLQTLSESQVDKKLAEESLEALIASNPTATPCSPSALTSFSQGKWQVLYAPHIRILEKVTMTQYDVYYEFLPSEDKMISYVRYESPVFRSGWLNTSGRVESVSESVCRVVWDKIWLDWNTLEQGFSKETQTNNHILPALIQTIGEKGFLEGASRFPVLYLDSDLCVFEFQITGTKICAKRI